MSYKTKNRNIDDLTPQFASKVKLFLAECNKIGYKVKIDDGFRTLDRQKYLLGQGRTVAQLKAFGLTEPEAILYARGGNQITWTLDSDHLKGTAIDIYFENWLPAIYPPSESDWHNVASIAEKYGISRPYRTRKTDKPHFVDDGKPLTVEDTRLFYQIIWEDEYMDLPRETFQSPEQVMEKLEGLSTDQKISELVSLIAILFTKLDQK